MAALVVIVGVPAVACGLLAGRLGRRAGVLTALALAALVVVLSWTLPDDPDVIGEGDDVFWTAVVAGVVLVVGLGASLAGAALGRRRDERRSPA